MSLASLLAVFVGAGLGACLRWWLSLHLNPVLPNLPFGTLAANLLGGYLVGFAVVAFSLKTHLPPEYRLLAITGFLGGLTTFSTYSAEVVGLLERGQFGWGLLTAGVHLAGSLGLTVLGMVTARWWWRGAV